MSVITKGRIFVDGEQLTAEKLNDLVDDASFNSSTAVDNSTTRVSASGAITVKPQGITSTQLASGAVQASNLATSALEVAYPVGSIYMNAEDSTDPSVLLGFGTWAAFGAGRVPVGIDPSDADFDTAEHPGGAKTHTLTISQIPSHRHSIYAPESSGTANQDVVDGGVMGSNDGNRRYVNNNNDGVPLVGATGSGQAHNNLQPYIVVYMWKRTA